MGRRLIPLDAQSLDQLPEACRHCTFWELGMRAARRGSDEAGGQKEAWMSSVVLETQSWAATGPVISVSCSSGGVISEIPAGAAESCPPCDAVLAG